MSVVSLKEVIGMLETLCNSHKQINSFYEGDNIIELYKSNEIVHTTALVVVQNAVFNPTNITVTIQLAVVDKVLKGEENAREISSNTLQVIGDLINWINQKDAWRYARVIGTPTATKLTERSLDVVNGWIVPLNIRMMKDNGVCDIPIS